MERKLAEFRARKKAQTGAEKPVREIQTEMKAIDDSPAVSPDTKEFLKPDTFHQSPHKQV